MNMCVYGEAYDRSEVGGMPYCLKVLPTAPGDEKTDDDGKSYFLVDKDGNLASRTLRRRGRRRGSRRLGSSSRSRLA